MSTLLWLPVLLLVSWLAWHHSRRPQVGRPPRDALQNAVGLPRLRRPEGPAPPLPGTQAERQGMSTMAAPLRSTPGPARLWSDIRRRSARLICKWRAARRRSERWSTIVLLTYPPASEPEQRQSTLRRAARLLALGYQVQVLSMPCEDTIEHACCRPDCPFSATPGASAHPTPGAGDAAATHSACYSDRRPAGPVGGIPVGSFDQPARPAAGAQPKS